MQSVWLFFFGGYNCKEKTLPFQFDIFVFVGFNQFGSLTSFLMGEVIIGNRHFNLNVEAMGDGVEANQDMAKYQISCING